MLRIGSPPGRVPALRTVPHSAPTIAYEIVARVGARVPRRWLNGDAES
jgi:hypothetical protein